MRKPLMLRQKNAERAKALADFYFDADTHARAVSGSDSDSDAEMLPEMLPEMLAMASLGRGHTVLCTQSAV